MVVDVCTLTLLIGMIAGVIFFLNGWGPTPGVRGLETRSGARGILLVAGTGIVLLLLDALLYRTPNFSYFTSYFLGLAVGWLALLLLSALLHVLWGIGRDRTYGSAAKLARLSRLVLEALGIAAPLSSGAAAPERDDDLSHAVLPAEIDSLVVRGGNTGPSEDARRDRFEAPGKKDGDGMVDPLVRLRETLKSADPAGDLDSERMRIDGAQRDLEQRRGSLESLSQEFSRMRSLPERAAMEVIEQKERAIRNLQEELSRARRFYASEPRRLHATLAEYDRLLASQEQARDQIRTLLARFEKGRVSHDELMRAVIQQRIDPRGAAEEPVGQLSVGERRLAVRAGEIAAISADALVSSDNNYLTMSEGVARALRHAGGEEIYRETRAWIPLQQGDVAITTAGTLAAKRIFHAVVIDFHQRRGPSEEVIRELVRNAMQKARELGFRKIAFPVLGSGAGGFPAAASLRTMLGQLVEELKRPGGSVDEAIVCLTDVLADTVDARRMLMEIETSLDAETKSESPFPRF